MSRKIKLDEADIQNLVKEMVEALQGKKFDTASITYTAKTTDTESKKAQVNITPEAYCKMRTLIGRYDKEIAWHGTVTRDSENTFTLEDIIMYPQEVTGSTVVSNDEKYPMWLMQQPEEIFNKLRFQGHSHVNFAATPSGTDLAMYKNMLQSLNDDDFYIFFIMNKKSEFWIQIYDLANNTIYETTDITVSILFGNENNIDWFDNQIKDNIITKAAPVLPKAKAKTKTKTTKTTGKFHDKTWRWDYSRLTYVPTAATEIEIEDCYARAKEEAHGGESYRELIEANLEDLHDVLTAFEEEMYQQEEKDLYQQLQMPYSSLSTYYKGGK